MTFQPATGKQRFQFLDDFAVAADRTVQPLQVAVDHKDQVVQVFAGRQGNGAEGFGFIRFTIAKERPHLLIRRILQSPVAEDTR